MTFGLVYGFSENYILPISRDEVVHGKGTLLNKMAGDDWQKFANLRAYYGFKGGYPGQETAVHGLRDRSGTRVEPRPRTGLVPARHPRPCRAATAGARLEHALPRPPRTASARRRRRMWVPVDRPRRPGRVPVLVAQTGLGGAAASGRGQQLHPDRAPLASGPAAGRALARGSQHRCRTLRRRQPRQSGQRRGRWPSAPLANPFQRRDHPAAGLAPSFPTPEVSP